jgi:peptidoglycan/xylan/chitin deacetylase (PgdA/CDA1 family)
MADGPFAVQATSESNNLSNVMPITLLYHDVTPANADDSSGFAGPEAARYKLTPEAFERHLNAVASQVSRSPIVATSADELRSAASGSWLMTFDDGGVSAFTDIAGQLERRGWRGWFFVATDYTGTPSFCTRAQLRELHARGHVIGSHSCSHPERISNCSREQLLDEWQRSRTVLSEIIGQPVTTASVPGGFYSSQVARAAAAAGIEVLFNSEPTTRLSNVDGCLIVGRYNVYRGMPAADAASLISSPLRRWRQSAFWNAKKVAKTIAGPAYKALRQRLLRRAYAVDGPVMNASR